MGRSFDDIRAVLLTHAHFDHTGFAERARRAGATVRVHAAGCTPWRAARCPISVKIARPIRLRPALGFLAFMHATASSESRRSGRSSPSTTAQCSTCPARRESSTCPAIRRGVRHSTFPAHDALFVGDAINTYAVTSGRVGPQLSPFNDDRAQALDSLRRLEDVPASLVLPGHGVVWRDGVRSAVEAARAASD